MWYCARGSSAPRSRIEIFRAAVGGEPLYDATLDVASHYLAIVTDVAELPGGIPLIPLADPTWLESVADLIRTPHCSW